MQGFLNKNYDFLKWLAQIVLPAIGALYFGLAQIWGLPEGEKVVGSIVVIDTFLGVILGLSSAKYNNSLASYDGFLGQNGRDPDTGIPNLAMTLTATPDELLQNKTVRLKVGNPPSDYIS